MSPRKVSVVIVSEDAQQSAFIRRYLQRRGYERKRMTEITNPGGEGSGEQFVRRTFVREVRSYRQKSSYGHGGIALIGMIDADAYSVQERLEQINRELEAEGLAPIRPNEKIAVFVPERNIETWLRYANGLEIEPGRAYPKRSQQRSCKQEVEQFVNVICRNRPPEDAPPSILHACDELVKVL